MFRPILAITFVLQALFLQAQIMPPDPLCVGGDTLFWDLPTNNCGPFNSYNIYASQNPDGPYSLLASVSNQTQDFYVHPNPGNDTWYYYMESDYNCPGETVLQSDTISNLPPDPAQILTLLVSGSDVEMEWEPSSSPQVFAYVIYRLIGNNVDPIDTVYSGSTYTDFSAEANIKSEQYYVLALDPCGNTSLFLDPVNTTYLSLSQDECARTYLLEWNPFLTFVNGSDRQEVHVSVDGGPFEGIATLGPDAGTFTFSDVEDGSDYCFRIIAFENGTDRPAQSNDQCATTDIVVPPDEMAIFNATLINGGVEVSWLWNTDAELASANIEVRDTEGNFVQSIPWTDLGDPLQLSNSVLLTDPVPDNAPLEYNISSVDNCGEVWKSKAIRTVYLEGEAPDPGEFIINWTPFRLDGAEVIEYEIYRQRGLSTEFVGLVPGNELEFTDFIPTSELKDEAVCYYVEARFSQLLPSGELAYANSRSNVICLRPEPKMYIPNVFSPTGENNREWKVFVQFIEPGFDYQLQVFNRWGALVFETDDPEQVWDGRTGGALLPSGVYIFRLRLETPTYGVVEQKGSITLIR
ncbi:MAG: T9SS type B sorting domain-containing protein [Bacteroidetes bacterium]|nr:T9SS type B sorting domain-containing protein [Bacteroidota bacterium]